MTLFRFSPALPFLLIACSSDGSNAAASAASDAGPSSSIDAAAAPNARDGGGDSATQSKGPHASLAIRVDGANGPAGQTAAPFSMDDSRNVELAPSLNDLRCGRVWIGTASAFKGVEVYFTTCPKGGQPLVGGHFQVPFQEGTFPGSGVSAPIIAVSVGSPSDKTLTRYGSRKKVTEAKMTVSNVSADASAQPYQVGSLVAHVTGTLPADTDDVCGGDACGVGSDSIELDLTLTLAEIETAKSH